MFEKTFLKSLSSIEIAAGIFIIILVFFYLGIQIRKYILARKKNLDESAMGVAEGSLLGLLALLLSFTFSMSSSRHDYRLKVIVEEANDIGTAVLRADLYPDSIRRAFRHDFKAYLASRIEFFEAGTDLDRVMRSLDNSKAIQESLWNRATKLGQEQSNFHRSSQMIPALNAMFDIVTTRNSATLNQVPELIIYLLVLLCITSALTLGYSVGKEPDWFIIFGFATMIAFTIYLIIDLDRPRSGVITMNQVNKHIIELRSMFKPGE